MIAKRYMAALGAFFVLGIALAACGGGVSSDSVATVAGNPISVRAFNHWMYVAAKSQAAQNPGQPVIVPNDPPKFDQCVSNVRKQIPSLAKTPTKQLRADCSALFKQLSAQVMDFLVKAYWYQAQAARQHITISDAQVNKAFAVAKKQQFSTNAQYQQFLNETGQTQQDILYRFRVNQIYTKLLAKANRSVSSKQIQSYYNSHKSQFGTPEERDLRIVLARTPAQANAAKAALAAGQSWSAVAKKYSTDTTTKNNGGQLLGVIKGQQDAALDSAAFSAPVGKVMGPVKGQFGYYLVEVTKIHPATHESLAAATPSIRATLSGQSQSKGQAAVNNAAQKQWKPKTQCRSDYAMADCSGYKAPASTTSTAPTSTAPTSTTPTPTTPTPTTPTSTGG